MDERQLLPQGVHCLSLEEVETLFARFQKSDRRLRLFAQLARYIQDLRQAQCGKSLILDGSFVMSCVDEPNDIDAVLIFPSDWDETADLKPHMYNLVSKLRIRKEYGIEVFSAREGSSDEKRWVSFFLGVNPKWCQQYGWPIESTKGIVRIEL